MNRTLVLALFMIFIGYSITSLIVEIPKVFNNIFYGVVSIFAVLFLIFYIDIGKGLKDRFNENKNKMNEKKQMKSNK